MQLARVTGTVVATQKHEKLLGAKLLLVQPVDAEGRASGAPLLAVDAAQAGVGEHVLVVQEGRAAVAAIRRPAAPAEMAVVGVGGPARPRRAPAPPPPPPPPPSPPPADMAIVGIVDRVDCFDDEPLAARVDAAPSGGTP